MTDNTKIIILSIALFIACIIILMSCTTYQPPGGGLSGVVAHEEAQRGKP